MIKGYEWKKILLRIQRLRSLPISVWKWFEDDKVFRDTLKEIEGKTMLKPEKLYNIYNFFKHSQSVPGDVAEIGVWKGGCLKMLSKNTKKNIFGFDLFESVGRTKEIFKNLNYDEVSNYLKDNKNVRLIKGDVKETLSKVGDKKFSFVHIDCDFPDLINHALEFFYPRVEKGGIIIIDDFGDVEWPDTVRCVKDFLNDKAEAVIPLTKQEGLIIKL